MNVTIKRLYTWILVCFLAEWSSVKDILQVELSYIWLWELVHNEGWLLWHAKANIIRGFSYLWNLIMVMNRFKIVFEILMIISHGNCMSIIQVKCWICLVRIDDGYCLVRIVDGCYKLESAGRMLLWWHWKPLLCLDCLEIMIVLRLPMEHLGSKSLEFYTLLTCESLGKWWIARWIV